jgi:hypothetical protein
MGKSGSCFRAVFQDMEIPKLEFEKPLGGISIS